LKNDSLSNDGLLAADATIRSHPDLAHTLNLLVTQHGEIVFERCYRDSGPADLHSAHSVTKSFVSTLLGILAGDGLLSLDAPVASLVDGLDLVVVTMGDADAMARSVDGPCPPAARAPAGRARIRTRSGRGVITFRHRVPTLAVAGVLPGPSCGLLESGRGGQCRDHRAVAVAAQEAGCLGDEHPADVVDLPGGSE